MVIQQGFCDKQQSIPENLSVWPINRHLFPLSEIVFSSRFCDFTLYSPQCVKKVINHQRYSTTLKFGKNSLLVYIGANSIESGWIDDEDTIITRFRGIDR